MKCLFKTMTSSIMGYLSLIQIPTFCHKWKLDLNIFEKDNFRDIFDMKLILYTNARLWCMKMFVVKNGKLQKVKFPARFTFVVSCPFYFMTVSNEISCAISNYVSTLSTQLCCILFENRKWNYAITPFGDFKVNELTLSIAYNVGKRCLNNKQWFTWFWLNILIK